MKSKTLLLLTLVFAFVSCSKDAQKSVEAPTVANNSNNSQEDKELQGFLARFHQSPQTVMDEVPQKKDAQGRVLPATEGPSDPASAEDMLKRRNAIRSLIMGQSASSISPRAAIENNDLVEELVDGASSAIMNLQEMEDRRLLQATLPTKPWSDDYWAIYKGILGYRYADPSNIKSGTWKEFFDFSISNPVENYILSNKINQLSPSEKYDLLVGDKSRSMTAYSWNEGKSYFDRDGKVEAWMGICHGWAPASFMLPRPAKAVTVKAVDGTPITFYPSDLKSLASMQWAQNPVQSNFIGGRCNTKDPKKDHVGRIIDQDCFDNNPGSWHASVVNQIGVSKRSFVLDVTYDYEVWNQPVYSYSYSYFNPETGATSQKFKDVMIPLSAYSKDKFTSYRSTTATHVVGVKMNVSYIVETSPNTQMTDSPDRDAVHSVTYIYDLELDAAGNILGGEWYSNVHPDFLWVPRKNAKALSFYDRFLSGSWDAKNQNFPATWSTYAQNSSQRGQPLAKVVETLVSLAQQSTSVEPPVVDRPTEPRPATELGRGAEVVSSTATMFLNKLSEEWRNLGRSLEPAEMSLMDNSKNFTRNAKSLKDLLVRDAGVSSEALDLVAKMKRSFDKMSMAMERVSASQELQSQFSILSTQFQEIQNAME